MMNSTWWTPYDSAVTMFALKLLCFAVLIVWILLANFVIFYITYRYPKLRTVPNLLIVNLAVTDFSLGIFVLPLSASYAILLYWPFGVFICKAWLYSDMLLCTASIWNLCAIALDRYLAITRPTLYVSRRTTTLAQKFIGGVWGISCLFCIVPVVVIHFANASPKGNYFKDERQYDQCAHYPDVLGFTLYSSIGSFFIPLLFIYAVYVRIYRTLLVLQRRRSQRKSQFSILLTHIASTTAVENPNVTMALERQSLQRVSDDWSDDEDEEEDEMHAEDMDVTPSSEGRFRQNKSIGNLLELESANSSRNCINDPPDSPYLCLSPMSSRQAMRNSRSVSPFSSRKRRLKAEENNRKRSLRDAVSAATVSIKRLAEESRRKFSTQFQRISSRRERRGVRVLGIVVGCFTLCWTPFFIVYVISGICEYLSHSYQCSVNEHVVHFLTWLGYSNSAVNPIVYTCFNQDYLKHLKMIIQRKPESSRLQVRASRERRRSQSVGAMLCNEAVRSEVKRCELRRAGSNKSTRICQLPPVYV